MDEPSSSSSFSASAVLSRSPAIDRHNPIITDSRRSVSSPTHPPPRVPNKNKKKNSINATNNKQKTITPKENTPKPEDEESNLKISTVLKKSTWNWNFTGPGGGFISPPGSTRYLLGENVLFENLWDLGPAQKVFPDEPKKVNGKSASLADCCNEKVVVLRVSLHCRGCERKMRKHLSRMEGVKSFDIDFMAKKVTVTGNITPLEVLSSISKVKNAQLWSPSLSSFSSSYRI
ncbi:heavy metal transport/detoxification superfamily protein [Striga asiatica]|uniref:Heavy metal transport/detoxification superfamily protein n=1 Tax=Striga asiatica TaxID=4170 RepID=A0A5A7R9S1_STRAF|nr:heavy metal transport/detoxification superfamily protein [Striga asiatica]